MKILIVEDSPRLRRSLEQGLKGAGFAPRAVATGEEALACLAQDEYEVVVLDLMLPGMSGLDVLARLRGDDNGTHVLVLSARDRVDDRVTGLERGADDYLVKPFAFDELCARINALARRRCQSKNPRVDLGRVVVDTARKRVSVDGVDVHLTPSEYALVECLAMRRGRVLSQGQLMERLYRCEEDVSSNVVEVLVSGVRKKLQREDLAPVIVTRRGFGYVIEV